MFISIQIRSLLVIIYVMLESNVCVFYNFDYLPMQFFFVYKTKKNIIHSLYINKLWYTFFLVCMAIELWIC